MSFTRFKGGKLPPRRSLRIPALGDFLDNAATWPSVPARGWEFAVDPSAWGMLGNDQYGDCGPAGAMHLAQAQSSNAGNPLHATTEQTLALYSALTGFNPTDPSTDQGTVLVDLLNYWRDTGIEMTDAAGKAVLNKIVGYASLDISSVAQRRYAAFVFGGAYLGINCPQSAEQDTSNWTYQAGSPIAGGHCVVQVGEGAVGGKTISWGLVIPTTNGFYAAYLDEGYITVTESWLNAQGKSPSGLDLDGLVSAMKTLR